MNCQNCKNSADILNVGMTVCLVHTEIMIEEIEECPDYEEIE